MSDADAMIERALPMTHESWRSKRVEDMTPDERRRAMADAKEAQAVSQANYNNPPEDWDRDDMVWAYEAMVRANYRIKELKAFQVV